MISRHVVLPGMICNEVGAAKRLISESGSDLEDLILIKIEILL